MRHKILGLSGLFACGVLYAATDPIIMTVNGVDVPKSEFEYLYHKNNQQQMEHQSLDDYLELFQIYKMKVEDAKANGVDTTASFKKEMKQYRRELATPYITDSTYVYDLVDVAISRGSEEVEASHIMILKTRDYAQNIKNKILLDSIRGEILNGADFSEMASKYSQDRSVTMNNGYLGYISSGRYPYEFETAVFEQQPGQISEIVESQAGYHIIKTGARRPSRGRVQAAHIMKMVPPNATEEIKAKIKDQIDSLYRIVKEKPEEFGRIAKESSDDKGSARNEGKLQEFGSGEMVPAFEEVAFSLQNGEISEPILSPYGWHIIRKDSSREGKTKEEIRKEVLQRVNSPQDSRFFMVKKNNFKKLAPRFNASLDKDNIEKLKISARQAGIDSVYLANWTTMPSADMPVGKVNGKNITAEDVMAPLSKIKESSPEISDYQIDEAVERVYNEKILEAAEDALYAENEDYRNLMKEYEDGSMLYEISLIKVWDKASKDTEGLDKYFANHRGNYKLDGPRAKGVLVQAMNDSVSKEIKAKFSGMPADSVVNRIKKDYKGKAVAEKIFLAQGVNPMVDNIMFQGKQAKPSAPGFKSYFMLDERIIEEPESADDVKALVITDYQKALEDEWVASLKKKYPVKLNKKVIKKLE